MTRKNCMKRKIIVTFTAIMLLYSLTAFAVSYPPHIFHQQDRHEPVTKGGTAYMFHSGTNDVKKTIHVNDIFTVYRISPSCEVKEAGKIKVLSFVGETYIKGEVIEGEIKPDDIAKKGKVSCLVISAGICYH